MKAKAIAPRTMPAIKAFNTGAIGPNRRRADLRKDISELRYGNGMAPARKIASRHRSVENHPCARFRRSYVYDALTRSVRAARLDSFLVEVRRPPVAGPKLPGSFGRPGEKGFQEVRSAETVAIAESRRLGDTPKGLSTVIRCKTGGALSRSEDTSRASRVSFLLVSFHSQRSCQSR